MKWVAGITLFLLCGLMGEGKARRLRQREQTLAKLHELVRRIGDRQLGNLVSFREGALGCPPSRERDLLLSLAANGEVRTPLLTTEERSRLAAYARAESRSPTLLKIERDDLLTMLQKEWEQSRSELTQKGQIYRSVGYLSGAAVMLLVL